MDGSRIKEVFFNIYAELSAEKALSGHAYSRSVRGHMLCQEALSDIILSKLEFTDNEVDEIRKILLEQNTDRIYINNN